MCTIESILLSVLICSTLVNSEFVLFCYVQFVMVYLCSNKFCDL